MFYVYSVTNCLDGKVYVGRTTTPKRRWLCHRMFAKSGRGFALHQAMREDGIANFSFQVVSTFESLAEAEDGERALIAGLGSNDPARGYNATSGGYDHPEIGRISAARLAERAQIDPDGERERRSAAAKKAAAKVSADERRERMKKVHLMLGPKRMREHIRAVTASLSPDALREKARKANETLGPVGRQERSRRAMDTLGQEGLSARARKVVAAQTPEQRSAARRRSWVTRRAKKASQAHG